MPIKRMLTVLLVLLAGCARASADNCKQKASLSEFVNCRIRTLIDLDIQQTDPSRQSEANSAATNTTTIADHTSGPDFASSSLALPGLASKSSVPNSTDYSVGISMYAFYSMAKAQNPSDPSFYDTDTHQWRKVSFNFVNSDPADSKSSGSRTTELQSCFGATAMSAIQATKQS